MREVSVANAKSQFSSLLERAAEGEEIVITRRGAPVAMLTRAPARRQKPQLGTMAGTVIFSGDWEAPLSGAELDEFTNRGSL